MSRARGKVETMEYVSFSRRAFRGLMRRIEDADPEDVASAIELFDELEGMLSDALEAWTGQEVSAGVPQTQRVRTWTSLGRALGRSRQSVEQKYSARAKARQARARARYRAYVSEGDPQQRQ